ncbi:COR domain-containing protein [Hymenobacter puniceus]|uniref:COR domain-containing protein n=1 Tax=Hymenobacter sp. BT190 TaxID=2763505 RepID=UPI0016514745|nr:COR domain-containing protein [Hymenobacter sp. BT190]MBC6698097.1 GTP-binding protein [Hymenobacter sp. BT190]
MENKQKIVTKKPLQIQQIEKLYKISLYEIRTASHNIENIEPVNPVHYIVDKKNRVIVLSMPECQIDNIDILANFEHLMELNLTSNKISDISPLLSLKYLKNLYLGGNKIENIDNLNLGLIRLAIWNNPIVDPSPLSGLEKLKQLYCQNIGLDNIDFVQGMISLEEISLTENSVTSLAKLLDLPKIKLVDAEDNEISDINHLSGARADIVFDLAENKIKEIPVEVAEKYDWLSSVMRRYARGSKLIIRGNPLVFPPSSVIALGKESVHNYYDTVGKFGSAPISEGRIIVIGDGSAGKSSLIERLLHDNFELGKSQTNGINIDNWNINYDSRDLTFHIWDFGGQEIQHAVHKFFFTEGCLYILVLDNRKEEEPEYWLQQVESLGGSAPVVVVFNKQDDNITDIADRKFLKEKYANIVGFYNVSCKTGFGVGDLRNMLKSEVVKLRTVDEQFPNNWFEIKSQIEEYTSGKQHYLDFKNYKKICVNKGVKDIKTQKLLLKYFTTIGTITWFGETYLSLLHVLSPAWITQGVYKIVTSKKTAHLLGHISIDDFSELLCPLDDNDYGYEENHYDYLLSMMKKFDLCYTEDDVNILLPSAFGKEPKVEYSEFRGPHVRTYIMQFKDYMPIALIHRFIAKKLSKVYESNYWYSGIVIHDDKTGSLTMVQADKEAKRIYVRIKGNEQLGVWEYIRRDIYEIVSSYANINYDELALLEENTNSTVKYDDLVSYIQSNKPLYFHPRLQRDFNVGYLLGLFESKEVTLDKMRAGVIDLGENHVGQVRIPNSIINILNTNNSSVNNVNTNNVDIDIDFRLVKGLSNDIRGDINYLLDELKGDSELKENLKKILQFLKDVEKSKEVGDIKSKGWIRKLKSIFPVLVNSSDQIKKLSDGGEVVKSIFDKMQELTSNIDLDDIAEFIGSL